MQDKEFILFCDESDRRGKYYSNFYGGVITGSSQYQRLTDLLNNKKADLNLYQEVKWEKVTEQYLEKYMELIRVFFEEVRVAISASALCFGKTLTCPRD